MSGRKRARKSVLHGVVDLQTLEEPTILHDQVIRRQRDGRGRVNDQVVLMVEMPRQVRTCLAFSNTSY